jgi:hypothetical protein
MTRNTFSVFLSAVSLGALVLTFTSCTSQEEYLRKIRFGFRELNLPLRLKNAQLRLENDELEKRTNPTRIAVDTYMIDQGRAAIRVMNRFEEIWSYTIDHDTMKGTFGTGDRELMLKFSELERRFDDANDKCDDPSPEGLIAKTVKEAEGRCASFREIYLSVIPPEEHTFASAPGTTGGCVSEIEEVSYIAAVESSNHKSARQNKDRAQRRCDETLLAMKQEAAKCKNVAATTDESDADQTERFACVQEENRLSALGNARYADLNAAVRRLNAVTEGEKEK